MKLNEAKREVSTEGFDNGNHVFKIKQSQRAFEILSSNIYSDKILAVVREYGCNALDAHKSVGRADKAFNVHLPNQYEPFFKIRDFGPGLSDENVTVLFTTYFESTKDSSNDFTGCLGLGSKSAFSYVDQFGIISYFEGKRTFYSAYLNADNVPQITMVSVEPTDEETGLEISLAVKPNDFSAFKEKAGQIFKRFPVAPNFTGNSILLDTVEYTLIGKNYRVIKNNGYRTIKGCVVQGCVQYPIDIEAFNIPLTELQKKVMKHSIELDFPIGKLNITASRERLNYDKVTQQNIIDRVDEVVLEITKDVSKKIAKVSSMYEARVLYAEILGDSRGLIATVTKNGILYKGQKVDRSSFRLDLSEEVPILDATTNLPVLHTDGTPKLKNKSIGSVAEYDHYKLANKIPMSSYETTYGNIEADTLYNGTDFIKDKTCVYVIKDISGISVGPILKFNFENKAKKVCVLSLDDMTRLPEVLKQFEGYPEANFFKLSTLPRQPKAVKVTVKKDAVAVRKFLSVCSIYSDGTFYTEEKEIDANKGGYYLMSYTGSIINEGIDLTLDFKNLVGISSAKREFIKVLHSLKELADRTKNFKLLEILSNMYIINSSYKDIPIKNKAWVSVYDALKPFINELYSVNLDFVQLAMSVSNMGSSNETIIKVCFEEPKPTKIMSDIKNEFATILLKLKKGKVLPDLPVADIMKTIGSNKAPTDPYRSIPSTISGAMVAYRDFLTTTNRYYEALNKPAIGVTLAEDIYSIVYKSGYSNEQTFISKAIKEDELLTKIIDCTGYKLSCTDILNLLKNKYKS